MTIHIDLGRDLSPYPGGRERNSNGTGHKAGDGTTFREDHLVPALIKCRDNGDNLSIKIDTVIGIPAGMWEESFGGLVRSGKFDYHWLADVISFEYENKDFAEYSKRAYQYMREEFDRQQAN